jgi:hypothetical protein
MMPAANRLNHTPAKNAEDQGSKVDRPVADEKAPAAFAIGLRLACLNAPVARCRAGDR